MHEHKEVILIFLTQDISDKFLDVPRPSLLGAARASGKTDECVSAFLMIDRNYPS